MMDNSTVFDVLSYDNPAFRTYVFYSTLLTLKVLLMIVLIARYRLTGAAFISEEDSAFFKKWFGINNASQTDHTGDVERVRRAHLNDLENIPLFIVVGFMYLFTNPAPRTACILFMIYTIARFMHTFVYAVFVIPQPARAIAFFTGLIIHLYISFAVVIYFGSSAFV